MTDTILQVKSSKLCDGWIEVAGKGWLPLRMGEEALFLISSAADSPTRQPAEKVGNKKRPKPAVPKRTKLPPQSGWMAFNDSTISLFPKVWTLCKDFGQCIIQSATRSLLF